MTVTPDVLYLIKGSAFPIEIDLRDDRDEPEDMTGITIVEFVIRTQYGSDGTDLLRVTSGFAVAGNLVTVPVTQIQSDALRAGTFVGGLKVLVGSNNFLTDPFYVNIVEPTT